MCFQAACCLFLIGFNCLFQLWHGGETALYTSIGEDDGWCAIEAETFAQSCGFGDMMVGAFSHFGWHFAFAHPCCPCLRWVWLAHDLDGFTC